MTRSNMLTENKTRLLPSDDLVQNTEPRTIENHQNNVQEGKWEGGSKSV
jgi:hypothetical protein